MTFQIFKNRVFAIALFMMASVSVNAQQSVPMQALIGQSLSKIQTSQPESFLNCVAELKRIDAMFPDSILPKYQMVLQSLNFSVMNPQAKQTEKQLTEAEQKDQGISSSTIRLSIGTEHIDDIIEDLENGFAAVAK